ncbi:MULTISPECIES: hypothetical protein [Methylobacterium]|uniref:Uncharacterized protein n=1 Tax=Methylobacterium thuringiense TaxID=1003091 RepID=A0ABQ4TQA9_9HYPH|nr:MULTISPECIES: hypothetical protein [Methylobacterium]TXN20359.1 hypothetical protein FV217_18230 [Methylobacterium sp. WL9]GJE56235.1 hypothetical protein EKPJFOCH_2735 [Methylobacterium thuringiense]
MRPILAGLVLLLLPSLASAECVCACVRGKAIAVCQPQAMVEPICQQVCVEKIEQSLSTFGGGGGGAGIGGGVNALGAAGSGIDRSR